MRLYERLAKADVAATVCCVAVFLPSLAMVGSGGRQRAKRAVCLANLRQLTAVWLVYADENDGKIVNGSAGIHRIRIDIAGDGTAGTVAERAWVGRGWGANWNNPNVADTGLNEEQKRRAVREGALWPLLGQERVYRCPVARPHEFINYAIVDAMNGQPRLGTTDMSMHDPYGRGLRIGNTTLWIKNAKEIDTPGPAERMVFVGEGAITPDSFGVHYHPGPWWDDPPARHSDGATVSWADGHASHLQWRGIDTIERGRATTEYYGGGGWMPKTEEGIEDLEDFKRAVWGRLLNDPVQ